MATLQEQINWLRVTVVNLKNQVLKLLDCCNCNKSPHYETYNANLYYLDIIDDQEVWVRTPNLFSILNDKFPLNQNCINDKAILIMKDVTVYATWKYPYDPQDENSGWQEYAVTLAGTEKPQIQ